MTRPLSLLMLSLALLACAQAPPPTGKPAQTLSEPTRSMKHPSGNDHLGGYHWRLQDATDAQGRHIDALLIRPDQPIQFNFVDGRIAVHNACNGIGGDVRIDGDTLHFGALVSTKMACVDPAVMALDSEISMRLQGKVRFELSGSNPPQLLWTAANGDMLRFVGAPTPETLFRSPGEIAYLEVAARSESCPGPNASAPKRCLRVRDVHYNEQGIKTRPSGEWRLFDSAIQGYTHEEGIRHVLRVKRFTPDDKPADTNPQSAATQHVYILDISIESELVGP